MVLDWLSRTIKDAVHHREYLMIQLRGNTRFEFAVGVIALAYCKVADKNLVVVHGNRTFRQQVHEPGTPDCTFRVLSSPDEIKTGPCNILFQYTCLKNQLDHVVELLHGHPIHAIFAVPDFIPNRFTDLYIDIKSNRAGVYDRSKAFDVEISPVLAPGHVMQAWLHYPSFMGGMLDLVAGMKEYITSNLITNDGERHE